MISVITPVLPAHVDMLAQAHESLLSQDSGADWEWLIQIDGTPDGPVDETFPAATTDGRIRVAANGERLGISATRNRALLRSTGRWVAPLDADDEFFPNTLALLSEPLRTRPEVSFVFGESVDVFPDGKRLARFTRRPYEPGPVPPGRLEEIWRHHPGHLRTTGHPKRSGTEAGHRRPGRDRTTQPYAPRHRQLPTRGARGRLD